MYTDAVAKLHKTARNLMVLKGIPWFIQATLSDEGFVSMEDLATRPGKGDGAGGVGLRPQQPPLHGCDLPADRGPHVPGGSRGSTIHGSGGTCNIGTRAAHARGHCPEPHGLVRAGPAGEGLGREDQTHQTQTGPARKRPADEAPVQALCRRRDRLHPHEIPGKRTPGTRRTAMEDRQEDHGGWLGPGGRGGRAGRAENSPPTRADARGVPQHPPHVRPLISAVRPVRHHPWRTWRAGTSGSMGRTSGGVFPRQRTTSWQLPNATHGGRFTRRCMRATPSRRPCCRSGRTHCFGRVRSMRRSRPSPGAAHQPGHPWTSHHPRRARTSPRARGSPGTSPETRGKVSPPSRTIRRPGAVTSRQPLIQKGTSSVTTGCAGAARATADAPTSATSSWQRAASAWGTTSRRTARVD